MRRRIGMLLSVKKHRWKSATEWAGGNTVLEKRTKRAEKEGGRIEQWGGIIADCRGILGG